MPSKRLMPEDTVKDPSRRELSNTVIHVRDDSSLYLLYVRERLALVLTNQVNDQSKIEGICGEAYIAITDVLLANMTIGAQIDPGSVIEQKTDSLIKAMPKFQLVSA